MSLRFIIGAPGSGKSWRLRERLIEQAESDSSRHYIVIVPEQYTLETQKAFVAAHKGHSIFNIEILSFERLAYTVFSELSSRKRIVLDDVGKTMLLRRALSGKEDALEVYGRMLDRPGFIDELKSLMSEFGQYRIDGEKLGFLIEQTRNRPLLNRKLNDINILYGAFRDTLGEDMLTAEELLPVLSGLLPQSGLVRGSVIALDGFTGFTPAQMEVLEVLLCLADEVTVSVTGDKAEIEGAGPRDRDMFLLSRQTVGTLCELAGKHGIEIAGTEYTEGVPYRFRDSEELAFMAGNLFRYKYNKWDSKPKDISLCIYETPAKECAAAAVQVAELVREYGLRYRDIAIMCADMEGYKPYLRQAMDEADIPCFIDDRRFLASNPVVECVISALECIEEDFSYEAMFRYLKCGLTDFEPDMLFEAENYVIATGIHGRKAWSREWDRIYKGGEHVNLEQMNAFRRQAIEPLMGLYEVFKDRDADVRRMTEALFGLVSAFNAEEKLNAMSKAFEEAGDLSLSREYAQAYGELLDLFDRMAALMGDEKLSLKAYKDIFNAACMEISVGVIPAALDTVMVGDIQRSRMGDIKVLLLLGANDGALPAPKKDGGILSDADRRCLSRFTDLTPYGREKDLNDSFYFYLALARPQKKLIISYAAADEDGGAKSPSIYLMQLGRIFPQLEAEAPAADALISRSAALRMVAAGMDDYKRGTASESWKELYGCLYRDRSSRPLLLKMVSAAFPLCGDEYISSQTARALYGDTISGSVTRLERFAQCPYAHFLRFGLGLEERAELDFNAMDTGNLYHRALELCFTDSNNDPGALDGKARSRLAKSSVLKAAQEQGNGILMDTARGGFIIDRAVRMTDRTLWALCEQLKAGEFAPAELEFKFSPGNAGVSDVPLAGGVRLGLRGRIDRIDIYQNESARFVKIIDYKTGVSTDFSLTRFFYGLDLQLVLYLDTAVKRESAKHPGIDIVPAGMFYYVIDDPILDAEKVKGDHETALLKKLRPKGLFTAEANRALDKKTEDGDSLWINAMYKQGDLSGGRSAGRSQIDSMRAYAYKKIGDFGTRIAKGDVSVRPARLKDESACKYCEYKSVCGFEPGKGGRYNELAELKDAEVYELIGKDADTKSALDKDIKGGL